MTTTAPRITSYVPATGEPSNFEVEATSESDLERLAGQGAAAFRSWSKTPRSERAQILRALARNIEARSADLVQVAHRETGLTAGRLESEVVRTCRQIEMFAEWIEDGRYLGVVISPATEDAPDLRRILRPMGVVAVYAASNFPFAFGVLGGDTASALAAGCPVIVKAHSAQPETAELSAQIAQSAFEGSGAPEGLLSLVHGREAGIALVKHPVVKAAGFTGSEAGGRILFDHASSRPDPIPFHGELGSSNPVVVLPQAGSVRAGEIADGYVSSLVLGVGQFCTNPGLLLVPDASDLLAQIGEAIRKSVGGPMLTRGIRDSFVELADEFSKLDGVVSVGQGENPESGWSVAPRVLAVSLDDFEVNRQLLNQECFGPLGLVVEYDDLDRLLRLLPKLRGSLVGVVHAEPEEHEATTAVAEMLSRVAGRIVYNGWPTGVAVRWAMHHGGPWPAATYAFQTSVGATAINRWLAPIAYQNWPDHLLPDELKDASENGVARDVQRLPGPS